MYTKQQANFFLLIYGRCHIVVRQIMMDFPSGTIDWRRYVHIQFHINTDKAQVVCLQNIYLRFW